MASTPPSTTAASAMPLPVDSAALRSCPRCHRRMSSLKHDTYTLCSHCRDVNCNMTDRCDECREWSSDTMTTYLSYKHNLASKRSKKPQPAPVSQPAVTGSSVGPSSVSTSALADGDRLREAVLSAIQSLSQTGRLGTNPLPSTAPFLVPDTESHWVSSGGDGSHQPHNVGGTTRTSALGACVVSTKNSTTPSVPISVSHNVSLSHRSGQGMSHSLESHDSALLGSQSSQSLSLGVDQLRVSEDGSLGTSSSLSPTSLMFPLPDPGFSSLPASSTSLAPSSLPSASSSSSSFLPSSFSAPLLPASIPLPSFAPPSLSAASFPSSSVLSSSLPPSVPLVL